MNAGVCDGVECLDANLVGALFGPIADQAASLLAAPATASVATTAASASAATTTAASPISSTTAATSAKVTAR